MKFTEDFLISIPSPIALVGNATSAEDLGVAIDNNASVIRFNNFEILGYERHVGRKTTVRCTTGWNDIAIRSPALEISPFTKDATESFHSETYTRRSGSTLLHAKIDIHDHSPNIKNPSTGFALIILFKILNIKIKLFGFDGFRTKNYYDVNRRLSTHATSELASILDMEHVLVYGEHNPFPKTVDFCREHHSHNKINKGLEIYKKLNLAHRNMRIIEFGAGNGDLGALLQRNGNHVLAIEACKFAFEQIPIQNKINGSHLKLLQIFEIYDLIVAFDVLEHMTENDIKVFLTESSRITRKIIFSISVTSSCSFGQNEARLQLTTKTSEWWHRLLAEFFHVDITQGFEPGQIIVTGQSLKLDYSSSSPEKLSVNKLFCLPEAYIQRHRPYYYEDTQQEITYQPDVYRIAAEVAENNSCNYLLDIGCGQARKLAPLGARFNIIGVDYLTNIQFCRDSYNLGIWIESNLEEIELLPIPKDVLSRTLIICADVLEHLVNPFPLVDQLLLLLKYAPGVLISTPDRSLTHGPEHLGPPPNQAHIREWNINELHNFFMKEGFKIKSLGHTRSDDKTNIIATALFLLTS